MNHSNFESLPNLGAGIGLRKEHFQALKKTTLPVQWLEIIPENFIHFGGFAQAILDLCANRWPIVSHGVNLSIGSIDPLNEEYLERLKTVLNRTQALWFSDHLCFTSVGGEYFHDLIPLPFSHEAADHVIQRIHQLKKRIPFPFLLENPSYYVQMPGAEMSESDFFNKILEKADCGMLLDINNVYVNSQNHGLDAKAFILSLPLHRIAQIHLAGHKNFGNVIIDTHEGPIIDPVWELYQFSLNAIGRPISTLIEWDTHIPPLQKVIDEALKAQTIIEKFGWKNSFSTHNHLKKTTVESAQTNLPKRSPLAERREAIPA